MKILFTGGGSAGHIFPIIAIVRKIKENPRAKNIEFLYIGPRDKFSSSLLVREGIEVKQIITGKIRRYFSFKNFIDIFKMPVGFFQAFYYIFVFSPDLIFSKGGYGSVSSVIAGWFLLTPIILHESDVVPGLANKIASKTAMEIFIAFPLEKTGYFPAEKVLSVGNPVREKIFQGSKEAAKKIFSLAGKKPLILIMGGSQGAQRINNVVLAVLPQMLDKFEIIHQTGRDNFAQVSAESRVIMKSDQEKYYHPISFLNENELPHAYQASDIIISRSGAGSIFEIAAAGKPSILVPLADSSQDHQVKNAYTYSSKGAAVVMEELSFTPHFLMERLMYLSSSPGKLKKMKEKAREFSKPDAAKIISEYLVDYLTQ